jgi:molybdate transport system ATP-binding protein
VALGRALARGPRLLLLDEPFAALDRALRDRVRAGVADWAAARALPVVLVSHDEADLAAFGAEVWHLEGGGLTRG